MAFPCSETLRFDFKTPENALIAAKSLSVDDDLKPQESRASYTAVDNFLVFEVQAATPKHLQKAISTTLPSIHLIEQTVNELALD
jgi:tRNA threonylcarbamoyladenosine modification (KEOPS) complex  Pcc1 subunit